jgi:hypothetical protein
MKADEANKPCMLLQPAAEKGLTLHAFHVLLCTRTAYVDVQVACCALLHCCPPGLARLQQPAYSPQITADGRVLQSCMQPL